MKKKIVLLLCAIVATVVFYCFYQFDEKISDKGTFVLYGNVDIRDVVLGFRVSGRVEHLSFDEGDTVQAGDVMAILDRQPFEEDVALQYAGVAEAEAALHYAEKIYLRRSELVKTGAVSHSEYDDALAARDINNARLETAKARLKQAKTRLDDTKILAPNDGTILTRIREPGAIVSEGAPVFSLSLNTPVWIRTYIDEPKLGIIYPGMNVLVKTDSGGNYHGHIGFISPQAEFTPKHVETTILRSDLVYRIRIIIDDPDKSLRQGMPVTVSVNGKEQ